MGDAVGIVHYIVHINRSPGCNGSVLKAAALIIGGTWLLYVTANIPKFVESGAKIKASYGNAHIEIGRHKRQNAEAEEENTDKKEMDVE